MKSNTYKTLFRSTPKKYADIDAALSEIIRRNHDPLKWIVDIIDHDAFAVRLLKKLIDKRFDLHAINECLCWASANGHIDTVKLLLKKGANVHAKNEYSLRMGSRNGHYEVVKLLLAWGANIRALDEEDARIISLASANCQFEVVKTLLGHDANFNSTEEYALGRAKEKAYFDILELFKRYS
ncbi:MAG: ankyrin repeat domain-containing protein [Oligoflexales bacterium]|nr:ankyrin repeat domain-containing protein [Oligoflexales bacterium]